MYMLLKHYVKLGKYALGTKKSVGIYLHTKGFHTALSNASGFIWIFPNTFS
jgi:hypothetical protein